MAVRQDLIIDQGADWSFVWTKRNSAGAAVDLTGYSARAKFKDGVNGIAQAYLSTGADADGGSIALGGAAGTVTMAMSAAQSGALASDISTVSVVLSVEDLAKPVKTYIYDLELISPAGVVTRELQGRVVVRREITT